MKRNKKPHVSAMIYDGDFSLTYECVGVVCCAFALCELMPPSEESHCCYYEHGACRCYSAQFAALEGIQANIKRALKQLAEDEQ